MQTIDTLLKHQVILYQINSNKQNNLESMTQDIVYTFKISTVLLGLQITQIHMKEWLFHKSSHQADLGAVQTDKL